MNYRWHVDIKLEINCRLISYGMITVVVMGTIMRYHNKYNAKKKLNIYSKWHLLSYTFAYFDYLNFDFIPSIVEPKIVITDKFQKEKSTKRDHIRKIWHLSLASTLIEYIFLFVFHLLIFHSIQAPTVTSDFDE